MPRDSQLDERPVFGDEGMVDRPASEMNALGQKIRRQILEPQHMEYHCSDDNQSITIDSLFDFLRLFRLLATLSGRPTVVLHSDGVEVYNNLSAAGEQIKIRLTGDPARFMLTSGRYEVKQDGERSTIIFDPKVHVTPDELREVLVAGMPEANRDD